MRRLMIVLNMIKFEHTIFALPFAFLGAFLAAGGLPNNSTSVWIVVAMFGARSCAMAFNRLVDRHLDQSNPRTAERALPQGLVTTAFVCLFTVANALLFFLAAWLLNPLAFVLSPVALAIILLYSYSKRFTSFSHLALGLCLGIAPVGGWVAVTGELLTAPFAIALAVLLWVAGFDIIYACQDVDFDRKMGLFSIPARWGVRRALSISVWFHVAMVALLWWAFTQFELSHLSWIGLGLVALGLAYEHTLVKANDLTRVDAAFFTMNGLISVVLFLFVGLDLCLTV